jgi:predicted permease
MSVRLALGASRWRLARQLLVESVVLAALGAAVGLLFAAWASRVVVASLSTPDTPVSLDLPLDWRLLAVTALVTTITALMFGTGPALRASRAAPIEALKQQGRGGAGRQGRTGLLVVFQVALSLVLLVTAGLFLSTFRRLATLPLGFETGRVLVVDVDTARAHADNASRAAYYQQLVDAIATAPGAASAGASFVTPFSPSTKSPLFADPGRVHEIVVSPGYFATYGLVLEQGRDFDRRDAAESARVAVVSESYVRRFLAGRNPLESSIDAGPCRAPAAPCAIVGVTSDLVFGPLRAGARPVIYFPLSQSSGMVPPGRTTVAVSVRSAAGSPAALAPAVAGALTGVSRRLSFSYRPLEQDVAAALSRERLLAALSGFFAGLALMLCALGLYGVTAYATARRRTEIGIRLALGATPAKVVGLLMARVLMLTGAGIAAGVAVSMWASRFIAALLFDVQPRDPAAVGIAVAVLTVVAALATAGPAVRASTTDPAQALRDH